MASNAHRLGPPAKSDRNASERSLPFAVALGVLDGRTIESDDTRRDDGERRIIALVAVAGV